MPFSVSIRRESVVFPTYEPHPPDRNPMFLEKRVYQGSSGRVYPLPFCDRIAETPVPRSWDAVFIENEFLLVMILPQLGGRIHRVLDKTNHYDLIYYQRVIKPALVGLAGPWISGGIEFNWPQHHRPSTFMPADTHIEKHSDGSATVWLSEHDPMSRMKGMHGVCLHPGRAVLELKARVYNRTPEPQTFLWWVNAAIRVHEGYQSFFPPDVTFVADHAKRAMSTFPHCTGRYYGVDYAARARSGVPAAERPRQYDPPDGLEKSKIQIPKSKIQAYAADDLSWYANIPVPTSYMAMGTSGDFFGGYNHNALAGLVHFADHHIAPGKKQWTWGNHEFGYAWDRNLTDADEHGEHAPYIELMAGVFTDNQPDFSWLQPGETKAWSQYWYPIQLIGPAHHANLAAAVSLAVSPKGRRMEARVGVAVTSPQAGASVMLRARHKTFATFTRDLSPSAPLVETIALPRGTRATDLTLAVATASGRELIRHTPVVPVPPTKAELSRLAATEPPAPAGVPSNDGLYLTGLHLEQYRHATRVPEDYWREGLRRDPGDSRCHLALGRWHLRRGEFATAETHLRASVARLTHRNPNPADGEAFYHLGLCLRQQALAEFQNLNSKIQNLALAYEAFSKATWNHAWQSAGFHALAEIDCTHHDWSGALDHLDRSLRLNADNLRARNLKVMVLRRHDRETEAAELLAGTLALDPLDWWARHLDRGTGVPPVNPPAHRQQARATLACDTQTLLDLALDHVRAGFHAEALALLADTSCEPDTGTVPLVSYYRAWICQLIVDITAVTQHLAAAAKAAPDYCFPARLEEIAILEFAISRNPRDARAPYFLGNLLYDRRRHREAIRRWEHSARLDPTSSVIGRNLGIGYFNVLKQPAKARAAYERALRANPADTRLVYERDQLWKRLGVAPARRLRELERHRSLVATRDDLSVELGALLNQTGCPRDALALLAARKFQPWEGGEGGPLAQHTRAHLLLGRAALSKVADSENVGGVPSPRVRHDARIAAPAPESATPATVQAAITHFQSALSAPENLGEARHLLANQSDIHFWLGEACAAAGDRVAARTHWLAAATFKGDFQEMSVRSFSEKTYYSALAMKRLGRRAAGMNLLHALFAHARELALTPARIDYFATSLPTMLLFADDLATRQRTTGLFLEAQARLGLGQKVMAGKLLRDVLRRDPAHAGAADLLAEWERGRPARLAK